jgi:uncharacterized protein YycO
VPGQNGSGVRLDTAGEKILIGEINPSGVNKAMTLAAWVNWEGSGHATITHQGVFGKRGGWTDSGDTVKWFWEAQPDDDLAFRTRSTSVTATDALLDHQNEWTHVALTWDNGTVIHYINGVQIHQGSITFNETSNDVVVAIGCTGNYNSETFVGTIDEARIYDTALSAAGVLQAMTGDTTSANAPQPPTAATDVPRDVVLGWVAGDAAAAHHVYLGSTFADVNQADLSQAVSQGQTGTTFPTTGLEFGRTYYWRVDEVNGPPTNTVFKGQVWSFTVEPYAYPITGVTATASSAQTGMGPEKTVDGSGLTGDLHGTDPSSMWLSDGALPNWIQYDLGQVYKLHEMQVWNSNQMIESFLGFGARQVTVETSLDNAAWTPVADVPEFAQAPGAADYAANTTVSLDVEARYVRLTIESTWGGLAPQCGLSEVQFSYVPLAARAPQPAPYAEGVPVDALLDWRPGREATSHEVVFGTDKAAVAAGTATTQTVTQHGFETGGLDFGTLYYWKVDEIGPSTSVGSVWSFTTEEYRTIEDFESYTDQAGEEVFSTWIDGFTNGLSGSIVGLLAAVNGTFCESTIVHGGKRSVPFEYHNDQAPYYSEAERTFDTPQDWTVHGAHTLSLWLYGLPAPASPTEAGNAPADVYLTVKDSSDKSATVTYPNGTNVDGWTEWKIPLSDLAAVKLTAVKTLILGVGDRASPKPGAVGTVYFDDIRFGQPIVPVGLVASYSFEGDVNDSSGNGHHGTILGNPTFVAGPAGMSQALLFPGTSGNAVDLGTFDPSEKTGMLSISLWAKWNGLTSYWQGLIGKRNSWADGQTMWQVEANRDTGALSFSRYGSTGGTGPALTVGEWTHIAVTFDKTVTRFYVNGVETNSRSTWSFGPNREASVQIGCDNANGGNPFNGALDEVRLYDIALTPAEVLALAGQ